MKHCKIDRTSSKKKKASLFDYYHYNFLDPAKVVHTDNRLDVTEATIASVGIGQQERNNSSI